MRMDSRMGPSFVRRLPYARIECDFQNGEAASGATLLSSGLRGVGLFSPLGSEISQIPFA
jgi:hypothetical protein